MEGRRRVCVVQAVVGWVLTVVGRGAVPAMQAGGQAGGQGWQHMRGSEAGQARARTGLTCAPAAGLAPVEPAVGVVLAAVDEDAGALHVAWGDFVQGLAAVAIPLGLACGGVGGGRKGREERESMGSGTTAVQANPCGGAGQVESGLPRSTRAQDGSQAHGQVQRTAAVVARRLLPLTGGTGGHRGCAPQLCPGWRRQTPGPASG
jgi:hypothetical protein